jgi:hypothetical protein
VRPLGGGQLVVVRRRGDGDSLDEPRVRPVAAETTRDLERPSPERPRDDVRQLVAEDRMGVLPELELDLAPPTTMLSGVMRLSQIV